MAQTKPSLLFVDDEPNIRLTLGMYLEDQGFAVTPAATVPEALKLITEKAFDVLIADLNIGHPGDGFTVVSAIRRIHPRTVTFILTGFPAFETALQAIRLQVDDYITKPTDTDTLAQRIRDKLAQPKAEHYVPSKRVSQIVGEHVPEITRRWLDRVQADPLLSAIKLNDKERADHVPRVLQVALKISRDEQIPALDTSAARDHGIVRRKQGYTAALLVREARLLLDAIASCIQDNLLSIQVSYLIQDLVNIHRIVNMLMEESLEAFVETSKKK